MRPTISILCAFGITALIAGCNGTSTDAGSPGPSPAPANGAADPAPAAVTVESLRKELGLGAEPVPFHDAMEALETVWYEDAWTAMDDGRLADAAKKFVRAGHLLSVATPEDEHAGDEKFVRWMGEAAAAVNAAAGHAIAGDGEALRKAVEQIDEKRCVGCHKVYKKDD